MKSGTCILVLNFNKFVTVNLDKYCIDFDFEISAVKIQNESLSLYILSVYRAPAGNFMLEMEEVLKSLYTFKTEFIICGGFNTDYLTNNYRKNQPLLPKRLLIKYLLTIQEQENVNCLLCIMVWELPTVIKTSRLLPSQSN
jgi:hypothetical protein